MVAQAKTLSRPPPPPIEVDGIDLGRWMEANASVLTTVWRRRICGPRADPFLTLAQIDGLVDDLVREFGRSLADPKDLPGAPWGRIGGVLRLSLTRGADGLGQEFSLLREVLEDVAQRARLSAAQTQRLRAMTDAAHAQAQAVLRERLSPDGAPAAVFGGIVLETA